MQLAHYSVKNFLVPLCLNNAQSFTDGDRRLSDTMVGCTVTELHALQISHVVCSYCKIKFDISKLVQTMI